MKIPEDYLWKDNSYIAYARNPFITYVITNSSIYVNSGIINTSSSQISINKIFACTLKQNILQKFLGLGTIEIYTIGDAQLSLKLENIRKSDKVRELIMELIG